MQTHDKSLSSAPQRLAMDLSRINNPHLADGYGSCISCLALSWIAQVARTIASIIQIMYFERVIHVQESYFCNESCTFYHFFYQWLVVQWSIAKRLNMSIKETVSVKTTVETWDRFHYIERLLTLQLHCDMKLNHNRQSLVNLQCCSQESDWCFCSQSFARSFVATNVYLCVMKAHHGALGG